MTQYTSPDSIPLTETSDIIAASAENLRIRLNTIATATQQGLEASRQSSSQVLTDAKAYADQRDEAYRAVDRALWRQEDDAHEASAIATAKTYTDAEAGKDRARLTTVEAAVPAALNTARVYTDTRETAIRADFTTSHVAIDTDGTPYFQWGSMTARVLQDSDGTPYYEAA